MYKTLTFLKRKPSLSPEEFRAYYENHHRAIGEKVLGRAKHYVRRYVTPLGKTSPSLDFDVITEVWFTDRADYERQMVELGYPDVATTIIEDEERLFDRSKYLLVHVDEVVSDLSKGLRSTS